MSSDIVLGYKEIVSGSDPDTAKIQKYLCAELDSAHKARDGCVRWWELTGVGG